MAIYFSRNNLYNSYDLSYIKNCYAQKQVQNTEKIVRLERDQVVGEDDFVINSFGALSSYYFNRLGKDYLEGELTKEEYLSNLEDLYLSAGGWAEDIPEERKQQIFKSIVMEAHNGILDYYIMKNYDEGQELGIDMSFYYNSDYHYAHDKVKEQFIKDVDEFADKLGRDRVGHKLNVLAATVNTRMAIMYAGNSGPFHSFDEVPPPGTKIMCNTSDDNNNFWASISYNGLEYRVDIPFSYDTQAYKFSFAELLAGYGYNIPDEIQGFVNNITLVNYYIARFSRAAQYEPDSFYYNHSLNIFDVVTKYEANSVYEDFRE